MKFKNNHADKFLNELWERISKYSLLNASKNDIGDYIIYLLNKHCVYDKEERFFDKLSHAKIEKILKINSARIKSAENNIKIKYRDDNDILFDDFMNDLKENKITLRKVSDDKIKFTIENIAKRSAIEIKLKEISGATLDYSLNSEIVVIEIKDFIKILPKNLLDKIKEYDENKIAQAFKKLNFGNGFTLGMFFEKMKNAINEIAQNFAS
ncbi:hypothetical protein [Campylobacter sp.]|uniref:hypothetical protein n=1 Tax=Campylobacter sp. TaxID=205 RepID=UPI002A760D70|nr:hypothetical protein [Campylobacter sp.]MCI6565688.1 hypothetical protein [Campylobacter sp.]MCI6579873.1 hypothetical protein [Campylobacter sp.]MDY3245322.1 hypothetical protein [Campylobacter sp.]